MRSPNYAELGEVFKVRRAIRLQFKLAGIQFKFSALVTSLVSCLTGSMSTVPVREHMFSSAMRFSRRHFLKKLASFCAIATGGVGTFCTISLYANNEKFHRQFVMPAVQCLDPEFAHRMAVEVIGRRLIARSRYEDPSSLEIKLWGKTFANPIGLAAGFDKDGKALPGLGRLGFGFVEIGSVTPLPQEGNPRPRLFRLLEDGAIINRYGFNNTGHAAVYTRLQQFNDCARCNNEIVGVNLGKNKLSEDGVQDYVAGVKMFGPLADYLVINVSSPNTPGLRNYQQTAQLELLLTAVKQAHTELPNETRPPILVKLAPDFNEKERKEIALHLLKMKRKKQIDGVIISNTTTQRSFDLQSSNQTEAGGLSGKPLQQLSTMFIKEMYSLTKGEIPIVGVGGIDSGASAYEKIRAGASLVQLYSALAYEGFPVVTKIKRELQELLQKDGFSSIEEAVGCDCRVTVASKTGT